MARSITIKQERFARHYVGECDGNASAAYRKAYDAEKMADSTVWANACNLLKNSKVAAMVERLKAEHAEHEAITLEEITAALRRAMDGAAAAGQWSAASSAALGLAKLAGLLIEKRQISADPGADHLDAVALLAGAPRSRTDDDNVVVLQKTGTDDA